VNSDLVPRTAGVLASVGAVLGEAVRYGVVIAQLTAAGAALRGLSEQVRATYQYVEDCSASVDRLADQAASLNVDADTISEHREAAQIMRTVLAEAQAMAAECEELSTLFTETADAHEGDYGTVAQAANAMDVPMADREFYSNR
jgi:hypothetical protein